MDLLRRLVKSRLLGLVSGGYLLVVVDGEESESDAIMIANHRRINVVGSLFELVAARPPEMEVQPLPRLRIIAAQPEKKWANVEKALFHNFDPKSILGEY
jgi:hypothetical protein